MRLGVFKSNLLICVCLYATIISCNEPISSPQPVVQIPLADTSVVVQDTSTVKVDSCVDRLINLRTLLGCPEYVGGYLNNFYFSGNSDVNQRESLGRDYSSIVIRSFGELGWYAAELILTFNGEPEIGLQKPLTTDGDNLVGINTVHPDSVYVFLALWLDASDLNPPLGYKYVSTLPSWIRIDSSSYTTYDGEPVTDHFGALEATLVLNETEYIQDNVSYYEDLGFCVPDTIFLRDVCFDARTRDVEGPCRRKAGR